MSKKWAILLVLVGEAIIYLFLLIGLPMFAAGVGCTDWQDRGTAWPLYFIPGLIGVWFILVILMQKKETKDK